MSAALTIISALITLTLVAWIAASPASLAALLGV